MQILERTIERATCRRAWLEFGVRSLKLNVTGQTGWPDRMFLIPHGRPLFVEFKRPGGVVSARQRHILNILRSLGYKVGVCDSTTQALRIIKRYLSTGG